MDEEFEVQIKAWYKSWTVWAVVGYMVAMFIIEMAPVVREYVPRPHLWLTVLESTALLYLRIMHTRQPVTVAAATKPMVADETIVRDNPPFAALVAKSEPSAVGVSWRYKKMR